MFGRPSFARLAAWVLVVYGVFGVSIAGAMVLVGYATFSRVHQLQAPFDRERGSLVATLRSVTDTLGHASDATRDFDRSLGEARAAADSAATLSQDTSASFRQMAQALQVEVFGVQIFGGLVPQFMQASDQLAQLSTSLGSTRDLLQENRQGLIRVADDLHVLRGQVDDLATTLEGAVPAFDSIQLLPFEAAYFGMCLLVFFQSVFSIVAGLALLRQQRALVLARRDAEARELVSRT